MSNFDITARIMARDQASPIFNKVAKSGSKMGGVFSKVGAMATGVFGGMAAYAGVQKVVQGFQESISIATDYEYKLKQIGIFGGIAGEELDSLGKEMLELSKTNIFSVVQMEDAMVGIAKAGVPAGEGVELLKGAMLGAQASGEDLNTVTDILLSGMKAFQIDFSKSADVMDMLTIAANESMANVTDLGAALSYVGPVAYSANQNMGDMVAAISSLIDVGFEGSMAGTYLRQSLMKLADPTKEATETLDSLGLSLADLRTETGGMKALPDIIATLREKLLPIKEEGGDIVGILAQVFDTRAASAMAALIEQQPEKWADLRAAIDETGVVQEQANEMMDTAKGRFARFNATMDSLKISMGSALLPVLLDLAKLFEEKIVPLIEKSMPAFRSLMGVVGDLASWFGGLAGSLIEGDWSGAWSFVGTGFSGLGEKIREIGSMVVKNIGEWWGNIDWGQAKEMLLTGLKTLGGYVMKVGEWLGDVTKGLIDWFSNVDWTQIWGNVKTYLLGFFTSFGGMLDESDPLSKLTSWFEDIDWVKLGGSVKDFLFGMWDTALALVFEGGKLLAGGLEKVDAWLDGILSDETLIDTAVDNFFTWIESMFNQLDSDEVGALGENKMLTLLGRILELTGKVAGKLAIFAGKLVKTLFDKLWEKMKNIDWMSILNPFNYFEMPTIQLPEIQFPGLSIPSKQFGGPIPETGPYLLHKGEYVERRGIGSPMGGLTIHSLPITVYQTIGGEADSIRAARRTSQAVVDALEVQSGGGYE